MQPVSLVSSGMRRFIEILSRQSSGRVVLQEVTCCLGVTILNPILHCMTFFLFRVKELRDARRFRNRNSVVAGSEKCDQK